ncbi:hypothetical protein EBU99_10070 [bacterium]|nr:hypothetical protein [bacterium]
MHQKMLSYFKQNKQGIAREARFLGVLLLWIAFHIAFMRQSWTQIEEHELIQKFTSETLSKIEQFDAKIEFWGNQSRRLSGFVNEQPPAKVWLQQDSWAALLDTHPEWIATYIITRRQGFEASVAVTLLSRQVRELIPLDKDSPISWNSEAQSSALQLISSIKNSRALNLSSVRSLRKDSQWIQVAHKAKKSDSGWTTWVVHTFSEQFFPDLQADEMPNEAALYLQSSGKFIFSRRFPALKIETSELQSFMKSMPMPHGTSETTFALSKKPVWVAWQKSEVNEAILLRILPNSKIPKAGKRETPSILKDILWTFVWLLITCAGLWSSYKKGFWRLNFSTLAQSKENNSMEVEETLGDKKTHLKTLKSSLNATQIEREFCRKLLTDVGPLGEIKLAGRATAKIEASPSSQYKGSWWIVQNVDDNKVFVAVGDASGTGLSAATAAYSTRHVIEHTLKIQPKNNNSELLITQLFNLSTLATEGVLLGSVHISLFMAVIELDSQKMAFINAGYPCPILDQGGRKQILLTSFADPICLGSETVPIQPRWVNLQRSSHLTLCNIGARNTDLTELDDSELLKIFIYPFGNAEQRTHLMADFEAS